MRPFVRIEGVTFFRVNQTRQELEFFDKVLGMPGHSKKLIK